MKLIIQYYLLNLLIKHVISYMSRVKITCKSCELITHEMSQKHLNIFVIFFTFKMCSAYYIDGFVNSHLLPSSGVKG